ncbi:RagB/SusD family nutrient uptake outer membrane protein [Flavobacteriaceae bacterium F89]|uniref:RagB/SusD family nutrient uptake outer membrane protein n=1 Tax=Cerina litoralis TaxID=2874477 RepID=A0AAE3EWJ4_9FLAO|nr:RagB/SusD family nutrient uptake outer membrane protein [Cerina litoralis]MCG2461659.1 RagB/SusD family nutrient uptake outer membrane protein [Cerina litoralis]
MKKTTIIIISICFLSLTTCKDELDLLPLDRVTVESFYKTRSDFDGAIFASYSSIQDFWGTSTETLGERGEFWKLTLTSTDDVAYDNVTSDGRSQDIDNLQFRSSDVPFAAIYTQLYEGIYRANLVLENLDGDNELTAEDKTVLGAEAKFLRAWFHFQAMKMFGTPPLALKVGTNLTDLALPNATQDELYSAILDDLTTAAAGLPDSWDSSNTGRATSWTAKSYIGKVNVWKKDWPAAISAFQDVVQNGPYMLMPEYASNFNFDSENNLESIFEIQFGGPYSDDNIWVFDDTHSENFKASQGIARSNYWDAGNGAPGGKNGWFPPTQSIVDAFEPGDIRADFSIYKAGDTYYVWGNGQTLSLPYDPAWSSTGYTIKKYDGEHNSVGANHSPNEQSDWNNERWFRFSELKLLYAEALIEGGGDLTIAKQQIDDVRQRAGLPILDASADLTQAMRQEKRVELAFEPHRWFDIVRWGIGSQIFGASWDDKLNLFPFPLSEVDRSNGLLKQNPGY